MAMLFNLSGESDALTDDDATGSIPIVDIRLMMGRNGYWGRATPLAGSTNREVAHAVWKLAHYLEDLKIQEMEAHEAREARERNRAEAKRERDREPK